MSVVSEMLNNLTLVERVSVWLVAVSPVVYSAYKVARRVERIAKAKLVDSIGEVVSVAIEKRIAPIVEKLEEIHVQITVNGNSRNTLRDKFGKIEENLFQVMQIQRANLENSPQPRFECDSQGKCVWVNEALATLFGLSISEMTSADGNGWIAGVEEGNEVFSVWMNAVTNKIPYQREYIVRNVKTGARVLCNAVATPLFSKDGKSVALWNGSVNPIATVKP